MLDIVQLLAAAQTLTMCQQQHSLYKQLVQTVVCLTWDEIKLLLQHLRGSFQKKVGGWQQRKGHRQLLHQCCQLSLQPLQQPEQLIIGSNQHACCGKVRSEMGASLNDSNNDYNSESAK